MRGDGDGWVVDADGGRFWGLYGAAGLLLRAPAESGCTVLLQHRALWSHQGGTWALPGGARDSHESAVDTAVREAVEEAGITPETVAVRAELVTHRSPCGWSYTTVIADVSAPLATSANRESVELRWVADRDVQELPLHPAFAASWPMLRREIASI